MSTFWWLVGGAVGMLLLGVLAGAMLAFGAVSEGLLEPNSLGSLRELDDDEPDAARSNGLTALRDQA